MKVAFLKKRFSVHGGAERYLQTLLEQLRASGHELHVFAHDWSREEGVIFHKIDIVSLNSYLSVVTFNANVSRAVKGEEGIDCIVSFERTDCQDIYRAGEGCHAEWLRIRSAIEPSYRKFSFKVNPLHRVLLNLEKRLFSHSQVIVANSTMVKGHIQRHYAVPAERIRVIYNGVDLARFSPANKGKWRDTVRRMFSLSEETRVILFVGSGFKRKGLKTLIGAVSLLKGEDVKVFIIGKGDVGPYQSLAEEFGIAERVIFLGPRGMIEHFYAAADLFVLPTLYDPFSNATLEAMASGLPVITTAHNGASEFVENGREGFVVDDLLDTRALADRISSSLQDLTGMGRRARLRAEDLPIEKAAREFMATMNEVRTAQQP